jgi:hypothetical protein
LCPVPGSTVKGGDAGPEARRQELGAARRDDLVVLGADQQRRRIDPRRVGARVELVAQQPAHGKDGKAPRGDVLEAVVRRDEDEPCHRPHAREVDGDAAAEAAADHEHVRVLGMDAVEQRQRVGEQGCLGGRAAAAAVAAVVHQVDGVLGEGARQVGQVVRDVLGVAAEVDECIRTGVRPVVTSTSWSPAFSVIVCAVAVAERGCGK